MVWYLVCAASVLSDIEMSTHTHTIPEYTQLRALTSEAST
jgi:hypothetical protein